MHPSNININTMLPPRMRISFLILLLLLCTFSGSYGINKSAMNLMINPHSKTLQQANKLGGADILNYPEPGENPSHGSRKGKEGGSKQQARKLNGVVVLDYHDPGPNPSHDPGKGKGGVKVGNVNP